MPSLLRRIAKAIRSSSDLMPGYVTLSQAMRTIHSRPLEYDELVALHMNVPALYTCTHLKASVVAQTPLRAYRPVRADKISKAARKALTTEAHGRKTREAASNAEGLEEITDDAAPVNQLLSRWNPVYDEYSGMYTTALWLDLTGGVHIAKIEKAGTVAELWPLMTHRVWTLADEDRAELIAGYRYGESLHDAKRAYTLDEIIRIGTPSPSNPLMFHSAYQSCVHELRQLYRMTEFNQSMLENGGYPGGVITGDRSTTQEERDARARKLENKFGGTLNASRWLILGKEEGFEQLDIAKELGFLESAREAARMVFKAAMIPLTLLEQEDANLAGAARANPQFVSLAIEPMLRQIEDALNAQLAPHFGDGVVFGFDPVNPEEGDAQTASILYEKRIITRNEARKYVGYDETEGGDDFAEVPGDGPFASLFGTRPAGEPIGFGEPVPTPKPETIPAPASATAEAVQDTALNGAQVTALMELAASVAEGRLPRQAAEQIARAAFPSVSPDLVSGIFGSLESFEAEKPETAQQSPSTVTNGQEPPQDTKSVTYTDLACGLCEDTGCQCSKPPRGKRGRKDDTRERDIDTREGFAEAVRQLEMRLRETLGPAYLESLGAVSSATDPDSVAQVVTGVFRSQEPAIREAVTEPLLQMFQRGYTEGGEAVAPSLGAFEVLSDDARNAFDQRIDGLLTDIGDTTGEQIARAVRAGIENGATPGEVADLIRQEVPDIAGYRAERIARTEVSNALQDGERMAWKDSALVTGRTFSLSTDPCPLCVAVNDKWRGKVAGLEEPWVRAGETVAGVLFNRDIFGTVHPNCNCAQNLVLADPNNE